MINVRGKDMLFIEAHGHVWEKLHGIRFNYQPLVPLEDGRIRVGNFEEQFLPPETRDNTCKIEVMQSYEKIMGFDKVVLLQTPCYGEQYDYINKIIKDNPGKYVSIGIGTPQDKKMYKETAKKCIGEYGYKGLKFESPDIPFDMLADDKQFVFEELLKYNAYFMLDMGWGNGPDDFPIDQILEVARRYPTLKIILPHMGVSRLWDNAELGELNSLKKVLSILEYNENVYFDCSGIPMLAMRAGQDYPWPIMQDVLKTAKKMGAINRVMWGSDMPTVFKACTYKQHLDCVVKYSYFLSDNELENILGRTAELVWFDNK